MAGRCLDSYPLAPTLRAYVPLVLAHLRDMGKKGAPDAMRPFCVSLTVPPDMDERSVIGALDVWVDMVAASGRGAGVLLAEGRGDRQGTRHWHGLAIATVPERTLAAWWCDHARGTAITAQRIEAVATACLPLGSPEMEGDIRRVLAYALKQHTGSEIVARGWLGSCWRQASEAAPRSEAPPPIVTKVERPTSEPDEQPSAKTSARRADRGTTGEARTCARCGAVFNPKRRDARYCGRSCRNMASRDRVQSRKRAA